MICREKKPIHVVRNVVVNVVRNIVVNVVRKWRNQAITIGGNDAWWGKS